VGGRQQEPVTLPTSQHRNVPLVLPPIHTPCTFNINIISSSISGDYLDSVKENIKSIFNKNGHNVVFNNPRAARRTVRGSTDLTIVEDWSRSQARILRRIGEDPTQVGGMYIRRTNKIWGNDTVATLASIRDDVSNDLVLGQYISHEAVHYFLQMLHSNQGLMLSAPRSGIDINLKYDERVALAKLCGGRSYLPAIRP
jgi:hypothetical protein